VAHRTRFHLFTAVFLVDAGEGVPTAGPETTGVAFFSETELPRLSPGHQRRVPFVFKLLRGAAAVPHFDSAGE
jgi:hypothetical protein